MALVKSMFVDSSAKVRITTVMKYTKMKARTEYTTWLETTCPAIFSGATADGCTCTKISRKNCLIMISARNSLMPPPVEPLLHTTQLRNSIHIDANIGHREKSTVTRP